MRNVLLVPRIGCYVYAYLRSQSSEHGEAGTPYYVGKGKHGRGFYARAFDKNHNIHLPSDRSNVIILSDNMTDNDARQTEMFLIYRYGRIDLGTGCLRNLTDGGEGCEGRVVTEETRAKQSVSRKGKKMPPWTEERRSLASLRVSGSGNPFYGRKHSEESMIRASSTRKLNETGLENIRKAAQARKGTHPSEETRQKLREAGKRIIF